jgi:hypothetical protein
LTFWACATSPQKEPADEHQGERCNRTWAMGPLKYKGCAGGARRWGPMHFSSYLLRLACESPRYGKKHLSFAGFQTTANTPMGFQFDDAARPFRFAAFLRHNRVPAHPANFTQGIGDAVVRQPSGPGRKLSRPRPLSRRRAVPGRPSTTRILGSAGRAALPWGSTQTPHSNASTAGDSLARSRSVPWIRTARSESGAVSAGPRLSDPGSIRALCGGLAILGEFSTDQAAQNRPPPSSCLVADDGRLITMECAR